MKSTNLKGLEKPETRQGEGDFQDDNLQNMNVQEQIRMRAYQLYEQRGMSGGFELEDWLQAEAEIREARKPSRRAA